jgi:hypothetical protein
MDVLKAQGVQFAEGGSASLLPDTSLLMVRNSLQGMYEVEHVIENLKKHPITATQPMVAPPITVRPLKVQIATARAAQSTSSTPPASGVDPAAPMIGGPERELPGATSAGNSFMSGSAFQATGSGRRIQSSLAKTSGGAAQLLRDAELKVLLRHFETTVGEIADQEKALLVGGDATKQDEQEAKLAALKKWKDQLVTSINTLSGATTGPAPATSVPGLGDIPILGRLYQTTPPAQNPNTTPPGQPQSGQPQSTPRAGLAEGQSGFGSGTTPEQLSAAEKAAAEEARRAAKQKQAELQR